MRHKFADTSSEVCEFNQDIEDTRLFRYASHRATLAVRLSKFYKENNLHHLGNKPELYIYGQQSLNLLVTENVVNNKTY